MSVRKFSITQKLHSLSSQRFQALFHSLSKVLFIFPSRYLFAIGLLPIFSFRWSIPPDLSCTPKQPDSTEARVLKIQKQNIYTGLSPSLVFRSRTLYIKLYFTRASSDYISADNIYGFTKSWAFPTSLAATMGILVSFFSSA